MQGNSRPLVSCLCVTRNKPGKLRRAIECFAQQTYEPRELLIVVEDDDAATLSMLREYENAERYGNVRVSRVSSTPKLTLGELRNLSIRDCKGEYFCQWDDDDWYHRERIDRQMEAVTRNYRSSSLLTHWFMFDVANRQAYLSPERLWEGSILCKKSVFEAGVHYPALPRMEDTVFVNELVAHGGIFPLVAPSLYIYEIHQNNTWSKKHFDLLLSVSQRLSPELSDLVAKVLDGTHSVAEGSDLMGSEQALRELEYFMPADTQPNSELEKYRAYMND